MSTRTGVVSSELMDRLILAVGKFDGDVPCKRCNGASIGASSLLGEELGVSSGRASSLVQAATLPPYEYVDSPVKGRSRQYLRFTDKGLARWVELTERGAAPPGPPAKGNDGNDQEGDRNVTNNRIGAGQPPVGQVGQWEDVSRAIYAQHEGPKRTRLGPLNLPICQVWVPKGERRDDGHGVILTPREETDLVGEPWQIEGASLEAADDAALISHAGSPAPTANELVEGFFAELRRLWAAEEKWQREQNYLVKRADDELGLLRKKVRAGDALLSDFTNQLRAARDDRDAAKAEVERLGTELNRVSQRHADKAEECNQLRAALEQVSKVKLKPEELARLARRVTK
jgi:hypothetical protein